MAGSVFVNTFPQCARKNVVPWSDGRGAFLSPVANFKAATGSPSAMDINVEGAKVGVLEAVGCLVLMPQR